MVSTMKECDAKMNKIFEHLGGQCDNCESFDNLQIDHVDYTNKEFTISNKWGLSWTKLEPEINKCQLLCKTCHLEKSKQEGSLAKGWTNQPHWKHGTAWGYKKYKCRCEECCKAYRTDYAKYKKSKK